MDNLLQHLQELIDLLEEKQDEDVLNEKFLDRLDDKILDMIDEVESKGE